MFQQPGLRVSKKVTSVPGKSTRVIVQRHTFNETELSPESNWMAAWENKSGDQAVHGYVDPRGALYSAAAHLAELDGVELAIGDLGLYDLKLDEWAGDSREFSNLAELLKS